MVILHSTERENPGVGETLVCVCFGVSVWNSGAEEFCRSGRIRRAGAITRVKRAKKIRWMLGDVR